MLVRSGAVDVIAVDSVAALTPRAELEGQMGDQTVGLQARMMSQAMRKLAGNLNRADTLCLFTNQIREKVGVMFGSPETQPGGRALKFYSSQRLDIRRIETLKEGTEAVGNRVRVKVVKNKVAPPFRQAEFDIEFGKGISTAGCLIDLGIEHNVVTKSGSFFSYGDERLGQGRNNAKAFLDEHPEIAKEIESRIYEALEHRPRRGRADRPGGAAGRRGAAPIERRPEGDGIRSGAIVTAADPHPDPEAELQDALEPSFRYLGHRDRTVAEVRRNLERRDTAEPVDREPRSRSSCAWATSTTRASRGASPRTAAGSTPGGRSASSAGCSSSASSAMSSPPRWPATRARRARDGGRAAAAPLRGPADRGARARARAGPARPPRLRPRARLRRRARVRARGLTGPRHSVRGRIAPGAAQGYDPQ